MTYISLLSIVGSLQEIRQVHSTAWPRTTKKRIHWTLLYIDLVKRELLYINPLALPNEHNKAEEFADHWMEWALLHNQYSPNAAVPMHLAPVTMNHTVQRDGRNCGIFTMCIQ